MNKYRIVIRNDITADIELIMELRRRRFTRKEYNMAIQEMFMLAAINCDYRSLAAEISCNDQEVLQIRCETRQNGSEVKSTISVDSEPIRLMTVAA